MSGLKSVQYWVALYQKSMSKDHVSLLVSAPPNMAPSEIVK